MAAEQLRLPRIRSLAASGTVRSLRSSMWGFADQGLISATNFITMVLLARQLGPKGFGVFVLAYTVLMFTNSVQTALFTAPHNVLGATRTGTEYAAYTTATFRTQALFSMTASLIIAIAGAVLLALEQGIGWLVLAIGFATLAWQLQEFCRRVFYTQSDYRAAFINDFISYGGQTFGMILLWQMGQLTTIRAVLSIAIASSMGFVVGAVRLRHVLFAHVSPQIIREQIRENWVFGRWLLGSNLTNWLSGQLYPVLIAGFIGLGATGGLRAAQLLTAPANVLQQTLATIMPSPSARICHDHGFSALLKYSRGYAIPLLIVVLSYSVMLCLLASHLVSLIFGPAYAEYSWLVYAFAVFSILSAGDMISFTLLKSAEITRPAFFGSVTSAVFTLTGGILLVAQFGLIGAVAGRAVDLVIRNITLWSAVGMTRHGQPLKRKHSSDPSEERC